MSRIPCIKRSKSLHNVPRPTYINRGRRPINNNCPLGTPPSFRPGFQGQQRQYAANEFGLSPNEQFQDAQQFFNMPENQCQPPPAQGAPSPFGQGFPCQQRQYAANEFGLSANEQFQDAQQFFNMPENQCPQPAAQKRQYSPSEFGISPNEVFQDARIFRNLDFNTDRAALEQMRGPGRPAYQPRAPRLSGLPNECLDEMSFPSLNNSPPARSPGSRQREISQQIGSGCIDDVSAPSILRSLSSGVISCLDEFSGPAAGNEECLDDGMRRSGASSSFRPGPRSPQPDECIADAPASSQESQRLDGAECVNNEQPEESEIGSLYSGVLQRFEALKRRLAAESAERAQRAGQQASPQNDCISGAGRTTETQIDTQGGDIVKETVVEKSIIENGEIQKCTKHTITRRDACGNETSECNESKERCIAPEQGMEPAIAEQRISDHHQTPSCADPFMLRLACNVRRRLDFTVPGEITKDPCPPCEEQLGDESAPLLASTLVSSRRSLSLPSQQLGDMSHPSFGSSLPSSVSPDCLEDVSAPSLDMGSPISPLQIFPRMPSMPSQQLSDMSAPSFQRSMQSPAPEECVPSPARSMSMRSSPQRRSPPCEQICDMPARGPSPSPVQARSPSFRGAMPSPVQQECLDNVRSPSLARSMSMRSSPQRRSPPCAQMPAPSPVQSPSLRYSLPPLQPDCLDDESAPSLARSMSMRSSPRVRSLPSDQLCDMASPSFGSSLPSSISPDCLEDVSAPSLEMGSPISPLRHFPRMPSMPSQQLSDMSAPSFQRSMQSPAPEECAPSPARSMSMRSSPQRRSPPCEQICDMPARGPSPSPVQARSPSFRGAMPSPVQQECLDNVRSPSLARSMSMRSSPQRRSPPCVQMPAPSPVQSPSLRYSLPPLQPDCLDDESAPSLARSMSMRSSPRVRSLPSDQIYDMSSPSFGSSLPSSISPDCLEDVSAPSLEMGSPISPLRHFPRMPSMPSQQLSDMSAPSFQRSMQSPAPEECVPSPARSMSMRSSPQRRSPPCEQICDMPARGPSPSPVQARSPSFRGAMPSPVQQECLDNVRSPSLARSMSMRSSPQRRSPPCVQMPAPSPVQSPSLRYSLPPLQPDCLDDESAPSLARSMSMRSSPRVRSLPSDQIYDMSSPSFGSSLPSSISPDCLEDVSAPSLEMGSPISPLRHFPRMPSMPSQQLSDMSAPSFQRSMQSPAPEECVPSPARSMSMRSSPQRRSPPCEQICDMPARGPSPSPVQARSPSFRGAMLSPVQQECLDNVRSPSLARSMSMRSSPQRRSPPCVQMPAPSPVQSPSLRYSLPPLQPDCLDDESAPSLARSMSMRSSPRVCSLPSDQLCDMASPSFGSSLPSSVSPDCLEDVSAPSLEMGSPISPLRHFPRMPSLPSQQLSNMSEPSYKSSIASPAAQEYPSTPDCAQYANLSFPAQERSLPSMFSSQGGSPGMSYERYANYADVSLPSTFNSPIRPPPRPQMDPGTVYPNEPQCDGFELPPDNSYKETIEISASVHSIATRTIEDNRNISEISQPSFATMASSNQSPRSPANQSSPRGFETMANYMPFDQQIQISPLAQRMPNLNVSNPFDDSYYDYGCQ